MQLCVYKSIVVHGVKSCSAYQLMHTVGSPLHMNYIGLPIL